MRNPLIVNVLAALAASFFPIKKAAAQHCHLALHGRVTEAGAHEAVAFATLFLKENGRGAVTDEQGRYTVEGLCPGSYTVVISHLECAHFEQRVTLDESMAFDFELQHVEARLGEVVVREKAVELQKAQATATVSGAELAENQSKSLGEALKNLPGLTLLSTGATIAKPVIEGLHSNRIAILTNGVPLEGQQWGSEHAPEIDPFSAGKITVVKGAASVRYGPSAMGGAIVVEPVPLREKPGLGGWAATGFRSNGRAGHAAAAVDFRSKKERWPLAGRVQATAKSSGNLRSPGYFLGNTGTREANFSALFFLKKERWSWDLAASRFSQKLGVLKASHIGNLTDLKTAIDSPVPLANDDFFTRKIDRPRQQIEHNLLKIKALRRAGPLWKTSFQYAWQYNRREEYDRVRGDGDKPNLRFDIFTNSLDAVAEHAPVRHWTGSVGAQALGQQNLVQRGALIPDFWSVTGAVWAVERWRRYPHPLEYEIGARLDRRWQHVERAVFQDTLRADLRFLAASATGGIIWRFSKNGSLTANSGLAQRPPHVNELYAAGVHHGAATFEQGRADLKMERAWNSNLALEWAREGRFRLSSTLFFNQIGGFIYLRPTGELVLTVRGAFPKYAYEQSPAVLSGGDAAVEARLVEGLFFEAKASAVRGFRTGRAAEPAPGQRRDWLPLMPADRASTALRFVFPKNWGVGKGFFRAKATSVARQVRFDPRTELKAPPPGFALFGFDGGATFCRGKLDIGLSATNLTNRRYREYTDFFRFFVDAPGADFSVRARVVF